MSKICNWCNKKIKGETKNISNDFASFSVCGKCYDWQKEKEWKEYAVAMNCWKEKGKIGSMPRSPEERRIDEVNLRKHGER